MSEKLSKNFLNFDLSEIIRERNLKFVLPVTFEMYNAPTEQFLKIQKF